MRLRKLLCLVGLAILACTAGPAAQAKPTTAQRVGALMAGVCERYLATLSPEQRAEGVLAFDDPERLDWHNIPKPDRKGISLREMSTQQQFLCHELLRVTLSESGYIKCVRILSLEANLKEGEKHLTGGAIRDPLRYYLTIFGRPGPSGTWGWSFEGHHFSLNFVMRAGRVVCDTPNFWGANPAVVRVEVPGGPPLGTRTLGVEEQLGLDLLASLTESQRELAIVSETSPAEYRSPGSPQPPREPPVGLPGTEMTADQVQTLRALLATYCNHLAPELAEARMEQIEAAGLGGVHFAWFGPQNAGIGHSYRVQGPTFVLELVNQQSDPQGNPANHIHTVWRSLEGDFGVAVP